MNGMVRYTSYQVVQLFTTNLASNHLDKLLLGLVHKSPDPHVLILSVSCRVILLLHMLLRAFNQ